MSFLKPVSLLEVGLPAARAGRARRCSSKPVLRNAPIKMQISIVPGIVLRMTQEGRQTNRRKWHEKRLRRQRLPRCGWGAAVSVAGAAASPELVRIMPAGEAFETATAETVSGTLAGERAADVNIFLGVPFAAPPVGDRRWAPPQPVEPRQAARSRARIAFARSLRYR